MNNRALYWIVLVSALVFALGSWLRPGNAASTPASFEYKAEYLGVCYPAEKCERYLNALGAQGWELLQAPG